MKANTCRRATAQEVEHKRPGTKRKHVDYFPGSGVDRYRLLFEGMSQGAFFQAADGSLTDVNPKALQIFGLTRQEFLGRTSFSATWNVIREDGSPASADEHPSIIALKTGIPVTDKVLGVFNRQTNSYIWLIVNAIPHFRPGESTPYQAYVTLHDITERKHMETVLAQALEEKNTLLRELQHRVKNTLTIINSLVDLEAEQTSDPGTLNALKKINNRIYTFKNLYTMLSASDQVQDIRLNDYLDSTARKLIGDSTDPWKRMELRLDLDEMTVNAKSASMYGLILNELLTNALKYAFPGEQCGYIGVRMKRTCSGMLLEVADNGVGLPAGFDKTQGSGLGCKLVHMLAQQLGGIAYWEQANITRCGVRISQAPEH